MTRIENTYKFNLWAVQIMSKQAMHIKTILMLMNKGDG